MNRTFIIIFLFLLFTGYIRCQVKDSASAPGCGTDTPAWLKERIKEMTLDEKHYVGTKVFSYKIDTFCVYRIMNPFSSIYYDLYNQDGSRLDSAEMEKFDENKGEPLLIWENYRAVQFDSLKKNLKIPEK